MKRTAIGICLVFILSSRIFAGDSEAVIHVIPGVAVPVGSSNEWYNSGFGTTLYADVLFPYRVPLLAGGSFQYSFITTGTDYGVHFAKVNAHVGGYYVPTPRITLRGFGTVGYAHGFSGSGSGTNSGGMNLGLGFDARFMIHSDWDLGMQATWEHVPGLCSSLFFGLTVGYALTGQEKRDEEIRHWNEIRIDLMDLKTPKPDEGVDLLKFSLNPIYPAFYGTYNTDSFGEALFANIDTEALKDIDVSFRIAQFMDSEFECGSPEALEPGESMRVDINGLMNSSILEIAETTDVSGVLSVIYTKGRYRYRDELPLTVTVLDRNAMIWDDDRKAAAFVTPKDAAVQTFTTAAVRAVSGESAPGIDERTAQAAALFCALRSERFTYRVDPENPFRGTESGKVDFVQFPFQTLEYGGGDCDDLTVLFCSLLEAAGIPSALITVPGHILPAYDTGIGESAAGRRFSDESRLLIRNGTVWIPVETTLRDKGFAEAWDSAADQVADAAGRNALGFFPLSEAWRKYRSVAVAREASVLRTPEDKVLLGYWKDDLNRIAGNEVDARLALLDSSGGRGSVKYLNSRGVVFARYGRYREAEAEFGRALALSSDTYVPALMNMGNLAFVNRRMDKAAEWYGKARALDRDDPRIADALARAETESEPKTASEVQLAAADREENGARSSNVSSMEEKGELEWME